MEKNEGLDFTKQYRFMHNGVWEVWNPIPGIKNVATKEGYKEVKNLNTSHFEEAVVLDYNGVPTVIGIFEYAHARAKKQFDFNHPENDWL